MKKRVQLLTLRVSKRDQVPAAIDDVSVLRKRIQKHGRDYICPKAKLSLRKLQDLAFSRINALQAGIAAQDAAPMVRA